jgi:uncharacterized repeat protein (TIGR01451 family)
VKPHVHGRSRLVGAALIVLLATVAFAPGTGHAAQGSLQITKTADAASVSPGDPIGFTITVTNNSGKGKSVILVTDTLPTNGGTSWSVSPANPNCSISSGVLRCATQLATSFSVHIVSPTSRSTCGQVTNVASVSSPSLGSATSQPATTEVKCLTVEKTPDKSTVNAGDQVGYLIFAENNTSTDAEGFTVVDTLPSGLTWAMASNPDPTCGITTSGGVQTLQCGPETMPPAGSIFVHVTATTSPSNCPSISNSASVSATNVAASSTGPVAITVRCRPDLVAQSVAFTPSNTNGPDGYTVTIKNQGLGPADLSGVGVAGTYSNTSSGPGDTPACSGTIPSGTLAVGATVDFTVACSTDAPPGDGWLLVNVDSSNVVDETDETNNVGSFSLFSASITHDSSCTLTLQATWHNTQPGLVTAQWYLDGVFLFSQTAPGLGGTISGNTATFTVGPFTDTSPTTHAWQGHVTFLTGGINDGDVWSNVDNAPCGLGP